MFHVILFGELVALPLSVVVPLQGISFMVVWRTTDIVPFHKGFQHIYKDKLLTTAAAFVTSLVHVGIQSTPKLVGQVGSYRIGRNILQLPEALPPLLKI